MEDNRKSVLSFQGDIGLREISNELILKGTTTVGVVCNDGVVLSSDTRVTMGTFIAHKKGKKIHKIDNHIGMTISGSVADAQRVVEILRANARLYRLDYGRPIPVKAASRLVSNLLFSSRYAPLIAQVLVGGVDDTGPHIFSLDPLGSLTEEKCVSTGSGSPVAYHNLCYTRNAFVLATRPLPSVPSGHGAISTVVVDPETNVGIRVVSSWDTDLGGLKITLDLLFGVAVLDQRRVVEVESF